MLLISARHARAAAVEAEAQEFAEGTDRGRLVGVAPPRRADVHRRDDVVKRPRLDPLPSSDHGRYTMSERMVRPVPFAAMLASTEEVRKITFGR